ncbi:MAG: tRNA-intron lyase [Thermoprotei archaeon]|nr:MAG: tRNA-intron lyase [Thermoprotei archaeon]
MNEMLENMSSTVDAHLIGKRIIILDREIANSLYFKDFYGKFYGVEKPKTPNIMRELELSYFDALYLLENEIIKIKTLDGREVEKNELIRIFEENYENFKEAYIVYKDLKKRKLVVKSGMKFGSTFAVYRFGPGIDHAPFLVHVLPYDSKLDPLEIIRAGRLSHSVRKKFIIAYVNSNTLEVNYFVFKWFM